MPPSRGVYAEMRIRKAREVDIGKTYKGQARGRLSGHKGDRYEGNEEDR